MTIRSEQPDKNSILLFLSGRLDTASSSEFEKKINELADGTIDIIMDLKELDYISSSGLHVLILAHKKLSVNNRKLAIKNAGGSVKEVFEMTGFNTIVTLE